MAARQGRPTAAVELSGEERQTLERWARRPCTTQSLACARGSCSPVPRARPTRRWPGRWARRRRRCASGVVASSAIVCRGWPMSTARECRPRHGEMVERVLIRPWRRAEGRHPLVDTGDGQGVGLSRSSVQRIWHTSNFNRTAPTPSRSPATRCRGQGLGHHRALLNPPEAAAVLCVDEKSDPGPGPHPAHLPMRPGLPERRTHDYERHGTTTLFAALDLASGKVMEQTHRRHRAAEFKKFLEHVDQQVPAE